MGRMKIFETPEQLEKLIEEYFRMCDETIVNVTPQGRKITKPYTLSGLCVFLGINKDTLTGYSKLDEYSVSIKAAKLRCENYCEEGLLTGIINPVGGIFNLKNNHGWVDRTEIKTDVNSNADYMKSEVDIDRILREAEERQNKLLR